jgi:integrase
MPTPPDEFFERSDQSVPSSAGSQEGASSFLKDRQAESWCAGEPIRLDDSVTKAIARFSPKSVASERWARVQGLVTDAVATAAPTTSYEAHALLNVTSQLALWAELVGLPLENEVVLNKETIDRFMLEGCKRGEGTKRNYRRLLWVVGEAVLGPPFYPQRATPLAQSDPETPYSAAEMTRLVSWARGLRTERFRVNASVMIGLGAGCGLSSQEMSALVGDDVTEDDDGTVLVHVVRHRPRVVPVLRRHAVAVIQRARFVGERPMLFEERTRITRHQLPNFIERCPAGDAPHMNTVRLRATWIVGRLAARVDLNALAAAAGVQPGALVKYLRFVPSPTQAEARRQLLRDPTDDGD